MKCNFRSFLHLFIIGGVLVSFASCTEDDTADDNNNNKKDDNAKEVMAKEENYSHMNEAVEESEQSGFFADADANITVFVATNSAFEELFAEANVNSVSELEAQMGEEAFANLVMYHAINGRFDYDNLDNGHRETNAEAEGESHLTVYIENDNSTRLLLNGNDENGASTTAATVIEASNGNLIEIDAVIEGQSNYENIEDAEEEWESQVYIDFMTSAESNLQSRLRSETEQSEVLVTNDMQTHTVLSIYLESILDEDDLNNLLDATAQSALFAQYNVNTMAELLAEVTFEDLVNVGVVTAADVYAEMDAQDRTEYMNHLIFASANDLKAIAESSGSVDSEAGVTYNVTTNSQGQVVLTDNEGAEFILEGKSAQSVNGSVYTIAEIN